MTQALIKRGIFNGCLLLATKVRIKGNNLV